MGRRLANLLPESLLWGWWLRKEGMAVLAAAGLSLAVFGSSLYSGQQAKQPPERIYAVILRFGFVLEGEGRRAMVIARTVDGHTHQVYADSSSLSGCMRGSTVRLTRRGSMLHVEPDGCRPLRA